MSKAPCGLWRLSKSRVRLSAVGAYLVLRFTSFPTEALMHSPLFTILVYVASMYLFYVIHLSESTWFREFGALPILGRVRKRRSGPEGLVRPFYNR